MGKKTNAKRIARLEQQVMGMGFLLWKLQSQYGHAFGRGMTTQVKQAVSEYKQLSRAISDREKATALAAVPPPTPPHTCEWVDNKEGPGVTCTICK